MCQPRSYVQARGFSFLLVPRRLNFFETQINVMRNCVKRKNMADLPLLFKLHEIWLVAVLENRQNCYHQMSDFIAKMHQFDFGWGSAPDPAGGAYSAPHTP